jgi:hypothetical protein
MAHIAKNYSFVNTLSTIETELQEIITDKLSPKDREALALTSKALRPLVLLSKYHTQLVINVTQLDNNPNEPPPDLPILLERKYKHVGSLALVFNKPKKLMSPDVIMRLAKRVVDVQDVSSVTHLEVVRAKHIVHLTPLLQLFPNVKTVCMRRTVQPPFVGSTAPMRKLDKLSITFFRPNCDLDITNLQVNTLEVQRANIIGTGHIDNIFIKHDLQCQQEELGKNDPFSCVTTNEVTFEIKDTRRSRDFIPLLPPLLIVNNLLADKKTYPVDVDIIMRKEEEEVDIEFLELLDMLVDQQHPMNGN